MKKLLMLSAACACLLAASCSHNASLVGVGSAFRIGSGEASLWYGDGLFLNSVSRENVRFKAELDSTVGMTLDPDDGTYKGIKSLELEVGPQLGGYARELGESNPEALKSYYDALAKYYEYRAKQDGPAIGDEKSKSAVEAVMGAIKEAIAKQRAKGDADEGDADGGDAEDGGDDDGSCPTCGDLPAGEGAK